MKHQTAIFTVAAALLSAAGLWSWWHVGGNPNWWMVAVGTTMCFFMYLFVICVSKADVKNTVFFVISAMLLVVVHIWGIMVWTAMLLPN
jgi:hypothetical protein